MFRRMRVTAASASPSGNWPAALRAVLQTALSAYACLYLMELIGRSGRSSVLAWMINQPAFVWAEYFCIFAAELFLLSLFNRPWLSLAAGNLLFLFPAVVNTYKLQLRGEWLLSSDFGQADIALEVLPGYSLRPTPQMLFAACVLLLLFPALAGNRAFLTGWKKRLLSAAASILLLLAAVCFALRIPVSSPFYMAEPLYNNAGVLRALYETRPIPMRRPDGYATAAVSAVLSGCGQPVGAEAEKPDIFFIMSESLFDLVTSCDIQASEDPLDVLRAWQDEYAGCETLCHSYGGGTFDAEYEALTGYRASDTPGAVSANAAALPAGMDTLVTMLKSAGYTTTAIHPNRGTAYNRLRNYAHLGFDRSVFREDLPAFARTVGNNFPSDGELIARVIEQYDRRDPDMPWFCHVVTFQNHGGYAYDSGRDGISVANRTGSEKRCAETYLNGLKEHLEAVSALLSHLRESGRPAVVLLWGDHAPNLAEFGAQMGTGAGAARFYETPVLLWNNYGADLSFDEDAIAMYRLGAVVLRKLGLCSDPYLDWLAAKGTPDMLTPLRLLETDGKFTRDDGAYQKLDDTLYMLHYDRLLGENRARGETP